MEITAGINEFINYIDTNGVSVNTKQAYARDLKQLKERLAGDGVTELADVGSAQLMQYVDTLSAEGKSAATISRNVASMKKFFSYTHSRGYTFSNPAELLKAPKVIRKAPMILSDKDIKRLLNTPDPETAKGLRDRAMLELMAATGISVSELMSLKAEDVDLKQQFVTVGTNRRRITLGKRTNDALKAYSKARRRLIQEGKNDDGTYFLSCIGEQMTRQGFWKIVRGYGLDIGIENMTPQVMRHSFAVAALRHGKDVVTVQRLLGHASRAGSLEYRSIAVHYDEDKRRTAAADLS